MQRHKIFPHYSLVNSNHQQKTLLEERLAPEITFI
uniref:Bm1296 n=1 Tax=Brugia malayi TaxID=6279 RepID=A0A1I9G1Z2_BRUMA|nr:Bm1296 [Brugia malayi]